MSYYSEHGEYFRNLSVEASRFSKLSEGTDVQRKDGRSETYLLTFQNNEEGNKLCKEFLNSFKVKSGYRIQKKGRHSDRQGLADKGLASREWIGGTSTRHVRDVSFKHSEYFDVYVYSRY